MNEQKQKWIETNDQVCALLRQAHDILALSSLPLKREWQGLTDEEYKAIRYGTDKNGDDYVDYELFDEGEYGMEINIYVDRFAQAIEAKLKEKNT